MLRTISSWLCSEQIPSCRCFGCLVMEGYGMTETSCVISSMDDSDLLTGHVGSPNPACGKVLISDGR